MDTDVDPLFQDDVLRARLMTPSDKLLAGPRLFELACRVMLDGLRHRHPAASAAELQHLLRQHLDTLRRIGQPS